MFHWNKLIFVLVALLWAVDLHAQAIISTNPAGTEAGMVTRNIPSGEQTVQGEVLVTGTVGITDPVTVVQPTGRSLHIVCDSGCAGTGGTSAADDADFVAGTTPGTPVMGIYESSPTQVTAGDLGTVRIDQDRNLSVNLATQLDPTNDQVSIGARTTGGWTPYRLLSAASTNATRIKNGAGIVAGIQATNIHATVDAYAIFFDSASDPPTCTGVGTGTPTYMIPKASSGTNVPLPPGGIAFASGIGVCLTTAAAGTGSVGAGDVILNIQWK